MSTEDLRVDITDIPSNPNPEDWCDSIVFKLIHNKPIKVLIFLKTMERSWKVTEEVDFGTLQNNLFVAKCHYWRDLERILSEGPWTFEDHLVQMEE